MWRCWVCHRCRIVSYHQLVYCPNCPGKMEFVRGPAEELRGRFPEGDGEWTPAEWDQLFDRAWTRK
jgi:hypothetical protein